MTKQAKGKKRKTAAGKGDGKMTRKVQKLPPDAPEAHDEGPRLIPFAGPTFNRAYAQEPSLPTDGYVALADRAMAMWKSTREDGKRKGKS